MQIVWIGCIYGRRHSQGIVRLANDGTANHNPSIEHLLGTVGRVVIVIRIGGLHSEIVCYAPHSSRTESHVESFLTGVNVFGVILPGTMIQHLDLRGLSFGSLEIVDISLVSVPNQAVLDSQDFLDGCIRHGLLEILINTLPLLRALYNLMCR
jgi:hypothetical protein